MIGKCNTGGSGLGFNKPLIHVKASLGSIIEIYFNNILLKKILSDASIPNIDGETADYYYSVNMNGTWTVTATLGTNTISDTVVISSNEQYDLELLFGLMIIDASKLTASQFINNLITVGGAVTSIEKQGDELYIPVPSSDRGFQWKTQFDVTKYNYLVFEGRVASGFTNAMYFGLGTYIPATSIGNVTNIASKAIDTTTQSSFVIDISNIQGKCYFGLRFGTNRYIYLTKAYCLRELP